LVSQPIQVAVDPADPRSEPPNWEDATEDEVDLLDVEDEVEVELNPIKAVVLTPDLGHILVIESNGRVGLPTAVPDRDEPLWRAAGRAAGEVAGGLDVAGWAGPARAVFSGPPALTLLSREPLPDLPGDGERRWVEAARAGELLSSPFDRAAVRQGLNNLAPRVAAP
jgi:hypothetical protein